MQIKRPAIVIDTNVLISAGLLPESKSAKVLALAVGRFVIAQNVDTWAELTSRIVRKKFDKYFGADGRQRHLIEIAKYIVDVPQLASEQRSVDATDDKFLSLAIDAGASIIISGDADLKDIKVHKGVEIMPPAVFFDRYVSK